MIAIGCDHAAIMLKNEVIAHLKERGIKTKDFGAVDTTPVDYPDIALLCAESVAKGECEMGILICGTGVGMCLAANKVRGIRCAVTSDEFSAAMSREHNNANMIAFGARVVDKEGAFRIVDIFVNTPFSDGERHHRRVEKIMEIEDKYFK